MALWTRAVTIVATGSMEHPHYSECADADCERFPCRVYREGRRRGWEEGFAAGEAAGFSAGYAAGYDSGFAAGAASAGR